MELFVGRYLVRYGAVESLARRLRCSARWEVFDVGHPWATAIHGGLVRAQSPDDATKQALTAGLERALSLFDRDRLALPGVDAGVL